MIQRFLAVATIPIFCVHAASVFDVHASTQGVKPAGSAPQNASSTIQKLDFWQESEPLDFPTRTADATCADLNGDGWPELIRLGIAYGDPYGGTLGITLGGAYGMQGPEVDSHHLPSPRSVCAVDVNGDGLMDLVAAHLKPVVGTANQFTRNATLFIQTGAGGERTVDFLSPAPTVILAPGGEIVRLTDVDHDQIADLVSVGMGHELYYQKGLGLSSGTPAVPLFDSQYINVSKLAARTAGLPAGSTFQFGFANDLASGDFDGDSSTDLAVAAGGALGGGIHVFYDRPAGWVYQGFLTPNSSGAVTHTVTSLAVGDFDDDGLDDMVATSPTRDLTTLLNNGSNRVIGSTTSAGMTLVSSPGVGGNAACVASADFNGDSLPDVAFFDVPQQKVVVAYNPSQSSEPGVFSSSPTFYRSYDLQGSGVRALEACDVDLDGDLDVVGSYWLSQSTAVLQNERLPNARKPLSIVRLRGDSAGGALSDAFLPDTLEYTQSPNANLSPSAAAAAFTFKVSAVPGDSLRLRLRMRALATGVSVRLGFLDRATSYVHWVHTAPLATTSQELAVVVPDAMRFVSTAHRVHICVQSSGSGETFRTAIDQISVEMIQ